MVWQLVNYRHTISLSFSWKRGGRSHPGQQRAPLEFSLVAGVESEAVVSTSFADSS